MSKEGITVKKEENFSEWYTQIVQKAELADIRKGVQGFIVHMPWGFRILRKIYEYLEKEVEDDNHEPYLFPVVVKKENLEKEKEHAGFAPDVFWITRAGDKDLEEEFALKPTGETLIYPNYSLWIRSYNDLPYKGYQSRIMSYRNEKTTRPFLRGREFMFFETHDVFSNHEDAINQVKKDLEMSQKVLKEKCKIPFLFFKRPQWDKFKGANDTYTPDTIMPDGKRNQLGSTHDLAQNFSKAFDITFQDEKEKKEYAWQTCWGPGIWRMMAAIIGIHGDDKGLILPFDMAPIQVIIVPIFTEKEKNDVMKYCEEIKKSLSKYRTKIDITEGSPGFKYNKWEMKGVPLRIEVGPREMKSKTATISLRTSMKKIESKLTDIAKTIDHQSKEVDNEIEKRAEVYFKDNTSSAATMEELKKIIGKKRCFVKVPFCSVNMDGAKCAEKLKAETEGVNVCGTLYPKEEKATGDCIICKKPAKHLVYTAKSY